MARETEKPIEYSGAGSFVSQCLFVAGQRRPQERVDRLLPERGTGNDAQSGKLAEPKEKRKGQALFAEAMELRHRRLTEAASLVSMPGKTRSRASQTRATCLPAGRC